MVQPLNIVGKEIARESWVSLHLGQVICTQARRTSLHYGENAVCALKLVAHDKRTRMVDLVS